VIAGIWEVGSLLTQRGGGEVLVELSVCTEGQPVGVASIIARWGAS
jgi:hypothetical protein